MMTPEQAATFISAQIALLQTELAVLHAKAFGIGGTNKFDTEAVVALHKKYEPILNAAQVRAFFDQVNTAAR